MGDWRDDKANNKALNDAIISGELKVRGPVWGDHPYKPKLMGVSIVKSIQGNGHWDSTHGRLFKFEYEMEDGAIVVANHKTESSPFKVGDTVEYEITHPQHNGGKVKRPQAQQSAGGGGGAPQPYVRQGDIDVNDSILYQVALKGSMDYHIAMSSPQFENTFTSESINNLALQIAKEAKANIKKLSEQ